MWDSPKPVIGRINGAARAGGMGLVAACDLAIGVESASFAVNEVRIGVIPAIISVVLLRKLSLNRRMELFLTGEPLAAPSGAHRSAECQRDRPGARCGRAALCGDDSKRRT